VQLIEELKIQLIKNEKEIIRLRAEKDRMSAMNSGHVTVDDLHRKIRERESETRDISAQYEEIESSFIKKENMFKNSKTYMEEVLKQIG
jgi:hypothetical protein